MLKAVYLNDFGRPSPSGFNTARQQPLPAKEWPCTNVGCIQSAFVQAIRVEPRSILRPLQYLDIARGFLFQFFIGGRIMKITLKDIRMKSFPIWIFLFLQMMLLQNA